MSAAGKSFCIVDGVRRAKAWQLAGASSVRAVILRSDGTTEAEQDMPIDLLRSPKASIDMSTSRQANRFWRIWKAIRAGHGSLLPAVIITPGTQGTLITNVGWTY